MIECTGIFLSAGTTYLEIFMYSFIAKGITVGHLLTRYVLREVLGICVGLPIDLIVALFWMPDYRSYWKINYKDDQGTDPSIYYDGTQRSGFCRIMIGWIGEWTGYAVGSVLGAVVGLTLFVPDSVFRGIRFLKQTLDQGLLEYSHFIGTNRYLQSTAVFRPSEESFNMKHSWNIGAGTLGALIGVAPFALSKLIAFFIPVDASPIVVDISTFLGGLVGCVTGSILWLPNFILNKTIALIDWGRDTAFKGIALLYAKTKTNPTSVVEDGNACDVACDAAIHSAEFRAKVKEYKTINVLELLGGTGENKEVVIFPEPHPGKAVLSAVPVPPPPIANPVNNKNPEHNVI